MQDTVLNWRQRGKTGKMSLNSLRLCATCDTCVIPFPSFYNLISFYYASNVNGLSWNCRECWWLALIWLLWKVALWWVVALIFVPSISSIEYLFKCFYRVWYHKFQSQLAVETVFTGQLLSVCFMFVHELHSVIVGNSTLRRTDKTK